MSAIRTSGDAPDARVGGGGKALWTKSSIWRAAGQPTAPPSMKVSKSDRPASLSIAAMLERADFATGCRSPIDRGAARGAWSDEFAAPRLIAAAVRLTSDRFIRGMCDRIAQCEAGRSRHPARRRRPPARPKRDRRADRAFGRPSAGPFGIECRAGDPATRVVGAIDHRGHPPCGSVEPVHAGAGGTAIRVSARPGSRRSSRLLGPIFER